MPTTDALDRRFPSGEWTGFYLQPDSPQRYVMDCFLKFARGTISGEGDDPAGQFLIDGTYRTKSAECSWTKQYVGSHGVEYTGQARNRGIIGQWRIRGNPASWSGPFFIWPRSVGDLESAFERTFMEYELSESIARPSLDSAESQSEGGDHNTSWLENS